MSWDKYFKTITKKGFYESIESSMNYTKVIKIVERLYGSKTIEYIVVEDWNTRSPYIQTIEKDNIWKFFEYAFGTIKRIKDDIFYIQTELETTYICISSSLVDENGIMKARIILNITRCHSDNSLMELYKRGGCIMKAKADEISEKIAYEMCKEKCAIKIQRKCEDWLWKPICKDGKEG